MIRHWRAPFQRIKRQNGPKSARPARGPGAGGSAREPRGYKAARRWGVAKW